MAKLSTLQPDAKNANKGTVRGLEALTDSLQRYGAGRSILVDKHGRVIAGNKTLDVSTNIGMDDVVIVQTDGKQLVAVQRTDLDLETDEAARMLAYADNRVGDLDLDFDIDMIVEDLDSGLDLTGLWAEDELAEEIDRNEQTQLGDVDTDNERQLGDRQHLVKLALYPPQVGVIERAILATGNRNRGEALMEICEAYLSEEGQFDVNLQGLFEDEPA